MSIFAAILAAFNLVCTYRQTCICASMGTLRTGAGTKKSVVISLEGNKMLGVIDQVSILVDVYLLGGGGSSIHNFKSYLYSIYNYFKSRLSLEICISSYKWNKEKCPSTGSSRVKLYQVKIIVRTYYLRTGSSTWHYFCELAT